jgi:hypothetical protein
MCDTKTAPALELDLDRLAKLEAAATRAPWKIQSIRCDPDIDQAECFFGHGPHQRAGAAYGADADLICALRNAAPALIAAANGETLRQAKRSIIQLAATVATLRQDLTIVQDRHRELQHRYDELVSDHAWHSPDEHPIPFSCVHLWLKDYTTAYYGYRTNKGEWLMYDSVRFVPVIAPVMGWQHLPTVPGATPLWKMQAASIAAEQEAQREAEAKTNGDNPG